MERLLNFKVIIMENVNFISFYKSNFPQNVKNGINHKIVECHCLEAFGSYLKTLKRVLRICHSKYSMKNIFDGVLI